MSQPSGKSSKSLICFKREAGFRFVRSWSFLVVLAALFLPVMAARATINVIDYWRCGENDAGAVSGDVVGKTVDIASGKNLGAVGDVRYDATDISANAHTVTGSTFAINFAGNSYATNGVVSTAVDNFGMECWVLPTALGGSGQVVAYNGNTATSGWGIVITASNTWDLLFGEVDAQGSTVVVPNTWTHLALVRDGGTATLYVNKVPVASSSLTPRAPNGLFAIGAAPPGEAADFFTGKVDEVRVFTFAPGQFNVGDLLFGVLPTVATLPASNISTVAATLEGTVNPNGFPALAWFDFGTNTSYGTIIGATNLAAGVSNVALSATLSNVNLNATFHYRMSASNLLGIVSGPDVAFSTSFVLVNSSIPSLLQATVSAGDFENNGRLDLLIGGTIEVNPPVAYIGLELWHNNGDETFSLLNSNVIVGLQGISAFPADYDNDGKLDILVSGVPLAFNYPQLSRPNRKPR